MCEKSCSFSGYWGETFDSRFKPVQKFDSCSGENYSGGGQPIPGAAEQTVIAQSQHHQQFLGQLLFSLFENHVTCNMCWTMLNVTPTDASRALPDFVELDLGQSNTENISPEDVKALQSLYREHCEVRWSAFCSQLNMVHTCNSQEEQGVWSLSNPFDIVELIDETSSIWPCGHCDRTLIYWSAWASCISVIAR